jgi:hypothetical protein
MPGYEPSLPFGIANPGVSEVDTGGIPWEEAPATSHCHSWRYYDTREHRFLKRFPSATGRGRSELHVRFKNEDGSPPHYVYFFDSPEAGKTILEKLQGSPHPFKEVVHGLLIKGKVPYTKVAG